MRSLTEIEVGDKIWFAVWHPSGPNCRLLKFKTTFELGVAVRSLLLATESLIYEYMGCCEDSLLEVVPRSPHPSFVARL